MHGCLRKRTEIKSPFTIILKEKILMRKIICVPYYIAELVRAEKEHSNWLPEWSEFSYRAFLFT